MELGRDTAGACEFVAEVGPGVLALIGHAIAVGVLTRTGHNVARVDRAVAVAIGEACRRGQYDVIRSRCLVVRTRPLVVHELDSNLKSCDR